MTFREEQHEPERYELDEAPRYRFALTRRAFFQVAGAGILITALVRPGFAQRRSSAPASLGARFHIGNDGVITAFTGKVEVGQGSRTQLSQAVAEELRVPMSQIQLVMADTDRVPNDGGTYGSLTTPRTVPAMRDAAAAARDLILELAAKHWDVKPGTATIKDGVITHPSGTSLKIGELAAAIAGFDDTVSGYVPEDPAQTPQSEWTQLGQTHPRAYGAAVAAGTHQYPSDIKRPGMLYGKVLRPPSYGAELESVDLAATRKLGGAQAVRDGAFVGCTAATTYEAQQAIDAISGTAKWTEKPHPSSTELFAYLKENVGEGGGRTRSREQTAGDVDAALKKATAILSAAYEIPYIQHAPMEPRAAVAEWEGDKLTVWTGTQRPFGVRNELRGAFGIPAENIRVIVPDTGGGFGGKHTGDAAIEAARLAKETHRPISVQWTREEEFTWAYFRPAALIEITAGIGKDGSVTAWDYTNYNSGTSGIACPYRIENMRTAFKYCDSPLREGSYRALASTANNFAREAFIDVVASKLDRDPLEFRVAMLENDRLRTVTERAAEAFKWDTPHDENVGYGIACGTEKGSYVATCAEVSVDRDRNRFEVRRTSTAFDCGPVHNPQNLRSQIEGCVIMGLGGALTEAMRFENGRIQNTNFKQYEVPRFKDVPEIDIVLVENYDVSPVGAGETPIIGIAPAIANAVYAVTGQPIQALPIRITT